MRKKPRVLLTKKLIEKVWKATNKCFEDSKEEAILASSFKDKYLKDKNNFDHRYIKELREKVDELYLEKILRLPSEILQDIIFVHEKGRILRAPRTIETISSEIARRHLMNDSSESI